MKDQKRYYPKSLIVTILICTLGIPILYDVIGPQFFGNITNISTLRIIFSSVLIPYASLFELLKYNEYKKAKTQNKLKQENTLKKENNYSENITSNKEFKKTINYNNKIQNIKTKKLVKKK